MKRLLAFLFLSGMLIALPFAQSNSIFDNPHISKLVVVSKDDLDLERVQSGNQYYYATNSNFSQFVLQFDKIDGFNLYFKDYGLENILKDFKIDFFKSGDGEIYYGYTNLYNKSYCLNNKKVNVQIAVLEDEIIVGFPAILTGF